MDPHPTPLSLLLDNNCPSPKPSAMHARPDPTSSLISPQIYRHLRRRRPAPSVYPASLARPETPLPDPDPDPASVAGPLPVIPAHTQTQTPTRKPSAQAIGLAPDTAAAAAELVVVVETRSLAPGIG